jgi:hypothetical protein
LKEKKLEQLRNIFRIKVKKIMDVAESPSSFTREERKNYINEATNQLVYEVKIRIK